MEKGARHAPCPLHRPTTRTLTLTIWALLAALAARVDDLCAPNGDDDDGLIVPQTAPVVQRE